MNDFALIVLTALVNFLVTGLVGRIIVDGYKKEMDFKYDQQMEEFKANLQKLSFEQQTKFVKNHEKMVQTLEVLYQKYSIFVTELGNTILLNNSSNKKDPKLSKHVSPLTVELSQFHQYFNINKIYLSEESASYIFDRVWKSNIIFFLIGVHGAGVAKETLPSISKVTNDYFDTCGLNIDRINFDTYDSEKLIDDMLNVLRDYLTDIEKHYRMISSVK